MAMPMSTRALTGRDFSAGIVRLLVGRRRELNREAFVILKMLTMAW
jgi:hypothetical protein